MATSKKRQPAKSGRSTSGRKSAPRKKQDDPIAGFTSEVILLIILAMAIILLISNFGVGGFVGNAISSFFFGLFGLMAFVFPLVLFISVAFFMSNKHNPLAYKKLIFSFFFFLFLCALFQLLTEGYMNSTTLFDFYQTAARYKTGGGIVGGAVCKVFVSAFGIIGAYILIICALIICLVFMTQRSFLGFFAKLFTSLKGWIGGVRERMKENKPQREARAQERAQRQAEKAQEREDRRQRQALEKSDADEIAAPTKRKKKAVSETLREESGFLEGTKLVLPKEPEENPQEPEQMEFEIHRSEPAETPSFLNESQEKQSSVPMEITPEPEVKAPPRNPRSPKEEIVSGIENIKKEIGDQYPPKKQIYQFPPMSLLKKGSRKAGGDSDSHLRETAKKLQDTLHNFGVNVTVTNVSCGPTVTRYELQPEQGVKVSKIVSLTDDIKLNLATSDIRIEAPIPGKAAVGIEVPNEENSAVMLRDLLQSQEFQGAKSKLAFAAGKDIGGKPVVTDIGKMPHLLIAGATGSGKSVCINTLIMSILYKAAPQDVKLIMIDPKVVELSVYNGIPHLLIPVVTDPKKAAGALNWAVAEMTDRYNTFAEYNVRNLEDYNKKLDQMTFQPEETVPEKMPQIVIIVDELADLMMVAPGEVEDAICRLAQLARAAGIHLVIATQRPSVNVITGLIKANMPSRIAFSVSSGVDSRTILDMNGAEKLLGKGDMLFYPQGYQKPARLQGAYVSDNEVSAVVQFLSKKNPQATYSEEIEQKINTAGFSQGAGASGGDDLDTYFIDAGKFIIEKDKASIGMLQRMFKIGFNRAARIMDQLSDAGVVGPEEGTKPRKVLMSMEQFENYIEESL